MVQDVFIKDEYIKLDSFLKWVGEASSGSEAKEIIANGFVKICNEICFLRGKKLYPSTIVCVGDSEYRVMKK